jgi:hypothetical protein
VCECECGSVCERVSVCVCVSVWVCVWVRETVWVCVSVYCACECVFVWACVWACVSVYVWVCMCSVCECVCVSVCLSVRVWFYVSVCHWVWSDATTTFYAYSEEAEEVGIRNKGYSLTPITLNFVICAENTDMVAGVTYWIEEVKHLLWIGMLANL